jgi:hypothetical protein
MLVLVIVVLEKVRNGKAIASTRGTRARPGISFLKFIAWVCGLLFSLRYDANFFLLIIDE